MAGHPVDDRASDAHPVIGHGAYLKALAPVANVHLAAIGEDLRVHVHPVGARVLRGVEHGLAARPCQRVHPHVQLVVADDDEVDGHATVVLDLGRGGLERHLDRVGLVRLPVQPLPQLALLPTCQGGNRLRIVGLPLDERERLEYGVMEVRRDVGARIREQLLLANARADVASHLHDSVLQTLALIQRQADDPKAVAALARRQERELRQWLYGESHEADTIKVALETAAAEVEDDSGVTVDLVVVGDHELDVRMDALARASREAMLNAAKHSGADRVDVYAEILPDVAEVYVRDRGQGFEVGAVSDDRMGVRGSIVDRMARHDGTARIRSAPGEGTEVWLRMELELSLIHISEPTRR